MGNFISGDFFKKLGIFRSERAFPLLKKNFPRGGKWGGERHFLLEGRVAEPHLAGVEGDPHREFRPRTVFVVADNRKAMVGKLDADLVMAAGEQTDFQQMVSVGA